LKERFDMEKYAHIPIMGTVPSLTTILLESFENPPELLVKSHALYRRFAIEVGDNGLDTFGLQLGDYAVFREQRWPTHECSACLITFGDEVTMRVLEYINNPEVTLRVSGEKISNLELAPTDFQVIGVLDGIIKKEFAVIETPEPAGFDWGC
jgi:hypothetical protein